MLNPLLSPILAAALAKNTATSPERIDEMTKFADRNMDDLTRLRNKSFAMGDQVRPHRTNPDILLVSAQSMSTDQVIAWYKVNLRTQTCTCKSFARWANCRHLCRAAWEVRKPQTT